MNFVDKDEDVRYNLTLLFSITVKTQYFRTYTKNIKWNYCTHKKSSRRFNQFVMWILWISLRITFTSTFYLWPLLRIAHFPCANIMAILLESGKGSIVHSLCVKVNMCSKIITDLYVISYNTSYKCAFSSFKLNFAFSIYLIRLFIVKIRFYYVEVKVTHIIRSYIKKWLKPICEKMTKKKFSIRNN